MRRLILAALLLPMSVSAKERSGCAQNAVMDKSFSLKQGTCAVVAGKLEIRFLKIKNESRCPSDVQCGVAGDVTALFAVKQKGAKSSDIQIDSHGNTGSAIYRKNEIKLLDVTPLPLSTRATPQDEYTVTLMVSSRRG